MCYRRWTHTHPWAGGTKQEEVLADPSPGQSHRRNQGLREHTATVRFHQRGEAGRTGGNYLLASSFPCTLLPEARQKPIQEPGTCSPQSQFPEFRAEQGKARDPSQGKLPPSLTLNVCAQLLQNCRPSILFLQSFEGIIPLTSRI